MNMVVISIIMLIFSLISFYFSMYYFYSNYSTYFFWTIYSLNSNNMEFVISLDFYSFIFMSVVLLISSSVLMYSVFYMSNEKLEMKSYYIFFLVLFIISMLMLLLCPSIMSILLGWDWLGLSSFMLVIYYQNYSSLNSGVITFICNRFGDVFLLLLIGSMMTMGKSFMVYLILDSGDYYMMMLMLLCSITKSAQMPFSSWLPMAMSAPTPISSLVHSSTLVTAGVYLIIRYNIMVMEYNLNYYLFILSSFTMLMSGINSLFEMDLKKIIALSTLSQLGFMMSILSLGFSMVCLYHLLIHALFKSLLFMCAGILIHMCNNNQDLRYLSGSLSMPSLSMLSSITMLGIFSLMGLPFFSGFYSKDMILELYYSESNLMSMFIIFINILGIVMSFAYSMRMVFFLYFINYKFNTKIVMNENMRMLSPLFILSILSLVFGKEYYIMFFYFEEELFLLSFFLKMFVWIMLLMSIMLLLFFGIHKFSRKFTLMFSSMWYLDLIYSKLMKFWNYIFMKLNLDLEKNFLSLLNMYLDMLKQFFLDLILNTDIYLFMKFLLLVMFMIMLILLLYL